MASPEGVTGFPSLLPQLVEVNGSPCLKLTEDEEKMTIPGMKAIYRLYDAAGESGDPSQSPGGISCSITLSLMSVLLAGHPFMDLMALEEEPSPGAGQELGIHVLGQLGETTKVIPSMVEPLHRTYFRDGQVRGGPISWEVSSSTLGAGSRAVVASEMCQQLLCQPGMWWLVGIGAGWWLPMWIFPRGFSHMALPTRISIPAGV